MHFINPKELNAYLEMNDTQLLLIFFDKRHPFDKQKQLFKELRTLFSNTLQIMLLDIEYLNIVKEKFQVNGFPACIFIENGQKKDVLLGAPFSEILKEFIINNLPDKLQDQGENNDYTS